MTEEVWTAATRRRLAGAQLRSLSPEHAAERLSVIDMIVRYAHFIDGRDFDGYRSLFADRIDLDFSAITREPAGVVDTDGFVAKIAIAISRFETTQHVTSDHLVAIEERDSDGRARAAALLCNIQAIHLPAPGEGNPDGIGMNGRYTMQVRRSSTEARWLIEKFAIEILMRQPIPM